MVKLVERASDRILGMFVPKLSAQADPCYTCSPVGGYQWGAYCYCARSTKFYQRFKCGRCGWVSEGCKPRYVGVSC